MKKIAFYVEGQTEQFFINSLLIEIAGKKNIQIELQQFQGNRKPSKTIYPKNTSDPQNPKHFALIFDCMGDGGVKPRILQDAPSLFNNGYCEVIGLRDLYPIPQSNLGQLEHELINGTIRSGRQITQPLPSNTSIIIAVREVEDWFLAECNHYSKIDKGLLFDEAQVASLGFDPNTEDLLIRNGSAAEDLKKVYQLVGTTYNKHKNRVERTVECLDYANVYIGLRDRIYKLNELISKIDSFLT